MQAAVFRPGSEELRIESVELDRPWSHEVVVRTMATGLCHSDVGFMEGRNRAAGGDPPRQAPSSHNATLMPGMTERRSEEAEERCLVMGHEPAGIVEAVGDEVSYVRPGDHVVLCGAGFCGVCKQCLLGRPVLCMVLPRRNHSQPPRITQNGERVGQFANLGAFAEQMLVHESNVAKIDADMPFAQASLLADAVLTGAGGVLNTAKVEWGSTVAVFGCGGVGLSAVQGARIAGARQIIAVDILDNKLQMAHALGATHSVNSSTVNPVDAIFELTDGLGVDYAFSCAGVAEAAQQAFDSLGLRGLLTCIAGAPSSIGSIIGGEKRITGSYWGSNRFRLDVPAFVDLYRQGRLKLDEMITYKLPLERVNDALRAMKAGDAARSVIVFE